jgi:acetoin utilization deacetylase AcuC-like enzyme
MIILYDPRCADYGSSMRPEQPARVLRSAAHLKNAHPDWLWQVPDTPVDDATLLTAHTAELIQRIARAPDIDADTPHLPDIGAHARRAVSAALQATNLALAGHRAFSLMRPPGHHATRDQAMGFCYLNQIAVAALHAARSGRRVAVWDFDAHHGNGSEDILARQPNLLFASVHQSPGYPHTGTASFANCLNYPVAPHSSRPQHMAELARSWEAVLKFRPDLVLVSAGFDAFSGDPITAMTLEREDFAQLGRWLRESALPAAGVLEGGYSQELAWLIDDFIFAWDK